MFESFGRGFKMIGASIKLGWQDKRLLLPSILTVFTNILFGMLFLWQGAKAVRDRAGAATGELSDQAGDLGQILQSGGHPSHGLIPTHTLFGGHGLFQGAFPGAGDLTGLNGPLDQSGVGAFGQALNGLVHNETMYVALGLMLLWWLTNRFLEGVTTALVYSNLTDGPRSGKFSEACAAVFASLPALMILGMVTFVAKKLAGGLRNRKNSGFMGFGFGFLASVVDVFWTLAGHLILPSIVIEGTSFWGALKRADKIASGNLLTIGVGEVGVDGICRVTTMLVYVAGLSAAGAAYYYHLALSSPTVLSGILLWALTVVLVTALSIYIRAAFYTCLYVWAIDAEAVHESERARVRPPTPLAMALA